MVGCGVDFCSKVLFFTKNGQLVACVPVGRLRPDLKKPGMQDFSDTSE